MDLGAGDAELIALDRVFNATGFVLNVFEHQQGMRGFTGCGLEAGVGRLAEVDVSQGHQGGDFFLRQSLELQVGTRQHGHLGQDVHRGGKRCCVCLDCFHTSKAKRDVSRPARGNFQTCG